jgi:hypothetical protein
MGLENRLDGLVSKVESKFESEFEKFETSPVKTSIKWMLIIYFAKKVLSWINNS